MQETEDTALAFFAELILPLSIEGTFTYRIPLDLRAEALPGTRVVVQFGKNKIYSALILKLHSIAPSKYEARYILSILDNKPLISPLQLKFWIWLSSYYLCSLGEVMNAALPSGLKLESETKVIFNQEIPIEENQLSPAEFQLAVLLQQSPPMTISEISRLTEQKNVLPLIKSLFVKDLVLIHEELIDPYRPKKIASIRLAPFYEENENLKILFTALEKAPRQLGVLLVFLSHSRTGKEVTKKQLLDNEHVNEALLTALYKKGILEVYYKEVSRLNFPAENNLSDTILSAAQQQALEETEKCLDEKQVTLLHGITSSGKTHVYIKLIEKYLATGKQVLYLLPEIALTAQIIERLKMHFGNSAGIYHSRFNENERVETWNKVTDGSYKIILGARSAIFLPFNNLGLVIIDEEHDSSFKQYDPAPRYQARDAGIYLSHLYGAPVLLGSATPSIETYYNAQSGRFGLVELNERFGGVSIPEISTIDLRKARLKGKMHEHFSEELLTAIMQTLEKKEQVILFQNRRGYSPVTSCQTCGYVVKCKNCDVSLTYHKLSHRLSCHYCGYSTAQQYQCPVCGSLKMEEKGLGTEKIEEEIQALIPEARIARMDLDTTRKKNAMTVIMKSLDDSEIDILVGTQMVSKGLDFANVSLIGVLNADTIINFPDFRAFERSFQLLSQVSGRAGRRAIQGKVFIQSSFPSHQVLQSVVQHDYLSLYKTELLERQVFHYPPFARLIRIDLKHKDRQQLELSASVFGNRAKQYFGSVIIGPEDALIPKVRNWFVKTMLMKIDPQKLSLAKIKQQLQLLKKEVYTSKNARGLLIQIDVDPA